MDVFSYITGSSVQIMKSHVFDDTNVRFLHYPSKNSCPLSHPPFYNSNTFFELTLVTFREISEWSFPKDLRPTDLKSRCS